MLQRDLRDFQEGLHWLQEILVRLSALKGWLQAAVVSVPLVLFTKFAFFDVSQIGSPAMAPALEAGDHVLIYVGAYGPRPPGRGEIAAYQIPDRSRPLSLQRHVGRIVGLPEETVSVWDGAVWIDGRRLEEPYVSAAVNYELEPTAIPEGSVFILADDRNRTRGDSHLFGPVPIEDLIGRVWIRHWPLNRLKVFVEPTPYREPTHEGPATGASS